jgi:hypothetical protein
MSGANVSPMGETIKRMQARQGAAVKARQGAAVKESCECRP